MPVEAVIAGDGFRLLLRVLGYERAGLDSGADANWLMAEAELIAEGPGSFRGTHDVSLRTEELTAFRDELAMLVERLEGDAVLRHMEEQVGCSLTLLHGRGEFSGFVRQHDGAEVRVARKPTDQSYLQKSLRDFNALVGAFPIKGDPLA